MKKYLLVIQNTWDEIITYRVNFMMWRLRNTLQILTAYFLWFTVMPSDGTLFGYTKSLMLTYIIATSFLSAIVMSTRGNEIGENIVNGDLSIFLMRPINYFLYWFSRDIGDKVMNIFFSLIEIFILILILKPPLFFQTNSTHILLTIAAVCIAIVINFTTTAILSSIGFWSQDIWAPRFFYYVIVGFFTGSLFPLDIFPPNIYAIFQMLPFTYLIYFPIKLYLGQMDGTQIMSGFAMALFWVGFGMILLRIIWKTGIKGYAAYGR